MNDTKEDPKSNQLFFSTLLPINSTIQNYNYQKENSTSYPFLEAVDNFKNDDLRNVLLFLHNFAKVSLSDNYTYSPEFDESGFSDYLLYFIDCSTDIEVLYISLDILLNLTHYETEFRFISSIVQRNLYAKLNNLLQTPINENIYRKIFLLLSNISLSTNENRDEILSEIDFSFLNNSNYDSFYRLKDTFKLISKLLFFPTNQEIIIDVFNLIFPSIYDRCKENDCSDYKSFINFLYFEQSLFNEDFFEHYLLENEVITDIISYFTDFKTIKPKTKLMIISIFKYFIPMKPQIFKSLSISILEYIQSDASTRLTTLDDKYIKGYSLIMNQLFLQYKEIFAIEDLQKIISFLLIHENKVVPEIRLQIGFIVFQTISLFDSNFTHSNLKSLLDACNDWISSGITDLIKSTIELVIKIQQNEDSFEESYDFLGTFVEENIQILSQIVDDDSADILLKDFVLVILDCFRQQNNDS